MQNPKYLNDLKGGDIDLLLVTHSESARSQLAQNKAAILGKIFMEIDEEKIDLTVCNIENDNLDPFIKKIIGESVILHKWP